MAAPDPNAEHEALSGDAGKLRFFSHLGRSIELILTLPQKPSRAKPIPGRPAHRLVLYTSFPFRPPIPFFLMPHVSLSMTRSNSRVLLLASS